MPGGTPQRSGGGQGRLVFRGEGYRVPREQGKLAALHLDVAGRQRSTGGRQDAQYGSLSGEMSLQLRQDGRDGAGCGRLSAGSSPDDHASSVANAATLSSLSEPYWAGCPRSQARHCARPRSQNPGLAHIPHFRHGSAAALLHCALCALGTSTRPSAEFA